MCPSVLLWWNHTRSKHATWNVLRFLRFFKLAIRFQKLKASLSVFWPLGGRKTLKQTCSTVHMCPFTYQSVTGRHIQQKHSNMSVWLKPVCVHPINDHSHFNSYLVFTNSWGKSVSSARCCLVLTNLHSAFWFIFWSSQGWNQCALSCVLLRSQVLILSGFNTVRDPLPLHRVVLVQFLISKISLNGALSSLHSFTFSLNKVVLNILYLQQEKPHWKHKKLDLQRSITVCGTCYFPPKCFLNGFFFLMIEEGSGEKSYLFRNSRHSSQPPCIWLQ